MFKELVKFTKKDIQFGDVITLGNGERYVYAGNALCGENHGVCDGYSIKAWDENLKSTLENKNKDIVKIERNGNVIWEREEVREMTIEEISKVLGYEVKIVKGEG